MNKSLTAQAAPRSTANKAARSITKKVTRLSKSRATQALSSSTEFCNISSVQTPVGWLGLEVSDKGVRKVSMSPRHNLEKNQLGSIQANRIGKAAVQQLQEYFAGTRSRFELPLDLQGTPFQKKVWTALCAIPHGETRSYGELAKSIGSPKAARAVGMANNKNPIAIIVPCHRVIGQNGALVGYAGGLDRKKALLDLESENRRNR